MNGLFLFHEYLTPGEEEEIMADIPKSPKTNNHGRRNSVRRFWDCDPATPASLVRLRDRLVEEGRLPGPVTRVTINEYYPGDALGAHIDSADQGEVIAVVSLLSPAIMVFARQDHPDHVIELPPRSIVFMRGEARYEWTHAVRPVAALRYSVAFHGTPVKLTP